MKTVNIQIVDWLSSQRLLAPASRREVAGQLARVHAFAGTFFDQTKHLHGLTRTVKPLAQLTALLHFSAKHLALASPLSATEQKALLKYMTNNLIPTQRRMVQASLSYASTCPCKTQLPKSAETPNQIREQIALRIAACAGICSSVCSLFSSPEKCVTILESSKSIRIVISEITKRRNLMSLMSQFLRFWDHFALRGIEVSKELENTAETRLTKTLNQTAHGVLKYHLEHLLSLQYGLLYKEDIEYVHEMRVAVRRLRCAVRVFGKSFNLSLIDFKGILDRVGKVLGEIRDKDVFRAFLATCGRRAPNSLSQDIQTLIEIENRRRQRDQRVLSELLNSRDFRELRRRWYPVLGARSAALEKAQTSSWGSKPTSEMAPRILGKRLSRVLEYDRPLRDYSSEKMHKLRIACKRLRYTAEFLSEFYKGANQKILEPMSAMQDLLGDVRDLGEHSQRLDMVLKRTQESRCDESLKKAVGSLKQTISTRQSKTMKKASGLWNRLRNRDSAKFFRRLISQTQLPNK